MRVIYKYPLSLTNSQEIVMPVDAQILTAQLQNNMPCLWALIDTDKP